MVLINQMLPDEVCFLSHRFSSSEFKRIEPNSKALLKYGPIKNLTSTLLMGKLL